MSSRPICYCQAKHPCLIDIDNRSQHLIVPNLVSGALELTELVAATTKVKKPKAGKAPPWARLLIATILGYIATVLTSAALTSLLTIHRSEATMMSLLIAGLVYVVIFIRVFAVKTWVRSLIEVVGLALVSGTTLLVTKGVII